MKPFVLLAALSCTVFAQTTASSRAAWNQSFEPFKIIGNVYYVGAAGVSSFLIKTNDGFILLDGGLTETAPLIEKSIAKLGFRVQDVKILINSHAHFDHAGGLTQLQCASGARVIASAGDAPALKKHYRLKIDRLVNDGDTVQLGGVTMTAVVTPGHTRGCTTWTMPVSEGGKTLHAVFYCSTSVAGNKLVNNRDYPGIVADYERSFAKLRQLPCDVFLGAHPGFFHLAEKRAKLKPGVANPFIDPTELKAFVDQSQRDFERELNDQKAAARKRTHTQH